MNQAFDLNNLIQLRHQLHENAELSNKEVKTAQIIKDFISSFSPDTIYEKVGGNGLIFEFKGNNINGKKIGFRADIDALPIDETIDLAYASKKSGVAHKCGHDGHSTMVAALAEIIQNNSLENTIYLIFQPAEEIGIGAKAVVELLKNKGIKLDFIFGLHNLPGFNKGEIISKSHTFAAASTGMIITLKGKTSHAAEPENGLSPALAFSAIIEELYQLTNNIEADDLILCTVIQASLGEIAFGTTPGYAEIRVTLRANKDSDLNKLINNAEQIAAKHAREKYLKYTIGFTESFPSTENSTLGIDIIKKAAESQALAFHEKAEPFKWSEDFGHYKSITQSVFFGLGAGVDCPMLHNETYDFPDAILKDGIQMFTGIIQLLENKNDK